MMNHVISMFTPLQWFFIALVFTLFIIISLFWLILYLQPARKRNRTALRHELPLPSVSVVLCVTNEYKVLRRMLPILLQQDYPCYEVVVVNDRSMDNSETLLRALQDLYPHLQVRTTSTNDRFGRSPALALGMAIRAAQYETILSIEADCHIKDAHWIRSMASPYGGDTEIVLGHTTHYKCTKWTRCHYLQKALHYMGCAVIKRPYTGVGSNVLFKKSLFYDNNGFNVRLTREHFPIGVFIGEVANRNNCKICTLPSGVTHSHIKLNRQMRKLYRKMEKRSLGMNPKCSKYPMLFESTLRLLFYAFGITSIILFHRQMELLIFFGSILFLRLLSVVLLYYGVRNKLDDKGLAFPYLCWDVLFPVVHLFRIIR